MQAVTIRILELARINKVSDQAICRILGANRNKVDDWKKGKSSPTPEDVRQLALHFKVSADYLLNLTDNPMVLYEQLPAAPPLGQPAAVSLQRAELYRMLQDIPDDRLSRVMTILQAAIDALR